MSFRIVWKRFEWQKVGRFWLYYFHPGTSEWRYANITRVFKVYKDCVFSSGYNSGFRAGCSQLGDSK